MSRVLLVLQFVVFMLIQHQVRASNQLTSEFVSKFRQDTLAAHNTYRSLHHSQPLTLNPYLNRLAQLEAERLLQSKRLDTTSRLTYQGDTLGRNLAQYSSGYNSYAYTGYDLTSLFYQGSKNYDYTRDLPTSDHQTFTQLVWKDSRELGVGVAGESGSLYMIAVYYPKGNVIGSFRLNVLPN